MLSDQQPGLGGSVMSVPARVTRPRLCFPAGAISLFGIVLRRTRRTLRRVSVVPPSLRREFDYIMPDVPSESEG